MTDQTRVPGKARVLLAAHDGARYLPEFLISLETQTYPWELWWRDDGSRDGTVALLEGRGRRVDDPSCSANHDLSAQDPDTSGLGSRVTGATACFLALLRAGAPTLAAEDYVAFADQDDVWLPQKLARGAAALAGVAAGRPAIYAARQIYTDDSLRRIGISARVPAPGFPAALTQNVAVGCTVMLNAAGARLVAGSHPPAQVFHDWWSYLLVTAAGGAFLWDDEPVVLYRQHPANLVGAPRGWRRALAALRRGPRASMRMMRTHLAALEADATLITPEARATVAALSRALSGSRLTRIKALATQGLRRQTGLEDLLFRLWFLIG